MPVVKYNNIRTEDVRMDGAHGVTKANMIGAAQGWEGYALRVFRITPGGFTPHHQHDWEHVNYVIKGKGNLTIAGETFEISEKDFALVPPNTEHQFKNPFEEEFEFICIVPNRGA